MKEVIEEYGETIIAAVGTILMLGLFISLCNGSLRNFILNWGKMFI